VPGRPGVLNAWACWYAPCGAEIADLCADSRQPAAIVVLGVNVPYRATDAAAALGADCPSVRDSKLVARRALGGAPVLAASHLPGPDGSLHPIVAPIVFGTAEQVQQVLPDDVTMQ
jgi:hypothetical protein